ncbi:MAG: Rrf2 family transcriptional regulator [Lachnospiraceae bacterium]|nr:Rrf2 family transcriptional regulator [Lachnospiraceae bacterium]
MLFTRECDYAVRILRALSRGDTSSVQEICEKEKITVSIAYKLARKLEKAGILQSFRGMNGGYALAKPLEELTLYDVFLAVNQNLLLTECMEPGYHCSRNSKEHPCQVHREFARLQQVVNRELKDRTMAEVFEGTTSI